MRRRSVLLVALLLAAVTLWRMRRRWAQYNARALEYFLAKLRRGNDETTSALESRLRATAQEAIRGVDRNKLAAFPQELDVSMSGGGFKTSYSAGVVLGLLAINEAYPKCARIVRWSGASAGAMMGLGCITSSFSKTLVWAFAVVVSGCRMLEPDCLCRS